MRKKQLYSFLILIVLVILTCGTLIGYAETPKIDGTNTELVVDNAELLNKSDESKLLKRLLKFRDKYDMDCIVVTVNSLDGKSAMAYADDYLDYNNYKEDGILLLISMEERDWWISTAGDKGVYCFQDAGLMYIEDNILKYLSKGKYYKAFDNYVESCESLARRYSKGNVYKKYKAPFELAKSVGTSCLVGIVLAAMSGFIMVKQMKPVENKLDATEYVVKGSFNLKSSRDRYITEHTDIQKHESSSGGRSGGISLHTSSSGRSHGGRGGKF